MLCFQQQNVKTSSNFELVLVLSGSIRFYQVLSGSIFVFWYRYHWYHWYHFTRNFRQWPLCYTLQAQECYTMLETVTRALESLQDGRTLWEPYGAGANNTWTSRDVGCWKMLDQGAMEIYGTWLEDVGNGWEWEMLGSGYDVMICHDMSWYVMICHDMSWSILVDSDGCLDTCQLLGGLGWYWNFCARMVSSCSREDSYHTYRNLSEQGWNLDCN